MSGGKRFGIGDIQCRAKEMAFAQGTGQGFTVHRGAAAGIDEDSIRLLRLMRS